jgi:hypothetical protein
MNGILVELDINQSASFQARLRSRLLWYLLPAGTFRPLDALKHISAGNLLLSSFPSTHQETIHAIRHMRLAAMDPDLRETANIIPEKTIKRAPIACKRCGRQNLSLADFMLIGICHGCRRLRIKCVQENTVPPCMGCHNSSSIAAAAWLVFAM